MDRQRVLLAVQSVLNLSHVLRYIVEAVPTTACNEDDGDCPDYELRIPLHLKPPEPY